MYFRGTVTVDPSKATRTAIVKPTRAFGRMLFHLTAGNFGARVERETFTVVAILQQVNRALRAVGATDLVRLAVDDTNYYLDERGRDDDMIEAIDKFEADRGSAPTRTFKTIELVAQHDVGAVRVLIDVRVAREHTPGEHAVQVTVCGTMSEFAKSNSSEAASGAEKVQAALVDQAAYDEAVERNSQHFARFMEALEVSLDEHIGADATESEIERCIVRPKIRKRRRRRRSGETYGDPLFCNYYGWDDSIDYLFGWSDHMHTSGLHCRSCTLVDEDGASVITVGDDGFNAGSNHLLDSHAEFATPRGGDFMEPSGPDLTSSDTVQVSSGLSGWSSAFDSFFDSSGSVDHSSCGSASSCSSCSSCGSCGGD